MKSNDQQKPQDNYLIQVFESVIYLIFSILKALCALLIKYLVKKDFSKLKFLTQSHLFKSMIKLERLTVDNLKSITPDAKKLEKIITDPTIIPIGSDLTTEEPVYLTTREVNQHVLVAGATGEGKTTLMTTMIRHAMVHGRPIVIIDPKGDFTDVEKIKAMAKEHGRSDKFKLFSLVYPENSYSYNPLKVGTPEQLKSKLLESLDLKHEYYGSVAAQFLANLFDVLVFLKREKPLTLNELLKYLSSPNDLGKLDNELKAMPRSDKLNDLMGKMHILKATDRKDLLGIIAQINAMCLTEFDALLGNKENAFGEIDLYQSLNRSEILYFQMNTPGFADFSSRIGRLILQDLKLVTNLIQAGKLKKEFEFGVVFIDEFGSFASKSFAELLKMIRSTGIGMNLFFQGIGDLKEVSPSFSEQILGNTKIKIILRQEIDIDVETWSSMAGTVDAEIESYQTNNQNILSNRTGTGNVHIGKKTKIEFDVFKKLKVGQAVVINKGRHIENVIQVWQQIEFKASKNQAIILKKPNLFRENLAIKS